MDYSVVTELIFAYANGDFSKKGVISDRRDDLDMLIAGINMLGEELKATTVSRDYFSSLYDAVSDMILVVNNDGLIEDANSNFLQSSKLSMDELKGRSFWDYLEIESVQPEDQSSFLSGLGNAALDRNGALYCCDKGKIPVKSVISRILQNKNEGSGYLFIIEDIRDKMERETLVLRTIVETQEAERRRVADDLHDSLGQKLSAIKLYLNALGASSDMSPGLKTSVRKAKQIIDESIQDLRDIIFNQMPVALDRFGLTEALQELFSRLHGAHHCEVHLEIDNDLPPIRKDLEVVVYRIAQEFIQNSIKHSHAKNIYVDVLTRGKLLLLHLEDDGIGFDKSNLDEAKGRGMRNMFTRIRAFDGQYNLRTSPGKGVKISISFNLAKL
jgi:PAS domain S-box-containing protein